MKKALSVLVVACIALLVQSCGPTQQEAIDYNNKIVDITKKTEVVMTQFFENFDPDADGKAAMQKALDEIAKCKQELAALPDLKGGEAFKASGVEMMTSYENFFKKDVQKWVDAMLDSNRTEESINAAQDAFEKNTESVKVVEDKFEKAQMDFAKLYGFELK